MSLPVAGVFALCAALTLVPTRAFAQPAPEPAPAPAPAATPPPVPPPYASSDPTAPNQGTSEPGLEREGGLVVPFAGVHTFTDDGNDGLGTGLRLGALGGFFLEPRFAVAATLTFDVVSIGPSSLGDTHELMLEVGVTPLFVAGRSGVEVLVGPKLAFWQGWGGIDDRSGHVVTTFSAKGTTLGALVGVFVPMPFARRIPVGAIVSYDARFASQGCIPSLSRDPPCAGAPNPSGLLGFVLAVLF